jgi:hypothetical protein
VRVLVAVVVALVVAVVAGGLALVGSPEQARLEKLDRNRLSDLRRIAHGINVYWTRHDSLPRDLGSLENEGRSALDLTDPDTGTPYPYRVVNEELFEVCATFSTECRDDNRRCADWRGEQDFRISIHEAGEACFELSPIEAK